MQLFKRKEFYYLIVFDAISIISSMSISLALRYDFKIPIEYFRNLHKYIVFIVAAKLAIFYAFKLYHRMWKYTGIEDFLSIFVAVSASSTGFYILNSAFTNAFLFPRSVIITDYIITMLMISAVRIGFRLISKAYEKHSAVKGKSDKQKRVLIYGAGVGGEQIIREIERNNFLNYDVAGFIDDDKTKESLIIRNKKVLGKRSDIPRLISKYSIDEILIAIPSLKGKTMKSLVDELEKYPIKIKTLPAQAELIDGNVYVNQIRPVDISDLLGREAVSLDMENISDYLEGKCVLITGGGGSIGSEIARQIIQFKPFKIVLLGKGENSIFNIYRELEDLLTDIIIEKVIADIFDYKTLNFVFKNHKPDVVFHAAAHKHVHLMEINPREAFKNNVLGSLNVMKCAKENDVKRFVHISTDKAVNPENVMGATKRITELIMRTFSSKGNCVYTAVRFGNVLGSRGSVIPIFKKQIENGGPVTVTHKDVIRYFMTIPEASKLVIQAGGLASGGEIFLLDMGEPVKILDMAKELIRLSGFEPEKDIEIAFTGLKDGEKLIEELLTDEEGISATKHEKIFIAPQKMIDEASLLSDIDALNKTMYNLSDTEVKREIFKIVSKYS